MQKKARFFLLGVCSLVLFVSVAFSLPQRAYASDPPPDPSTLVQDSGDNVWVPDADVTFAGKSASRSASFMNWTLTNYHWSYLSDPLIGYWAKVRNIIFTLLLLVIFSASVVFIVTHGTNITVWEFVGKFIFIVLLITFSFALIQLLYQLTDILQGFFIKNPSGDIISSKDLLNIGFNYDFQGYRLSGMQNDEAAFIAINLTKITAITYYVMALILLVRKVILWFFIIVSPIFPLLILYVPIRNTAKIWVGEFFRWLLYAPLFTIFLSGLVILWQSQIKLLPFRFIPNTPYYKESVVKGYEKNPLYPTAINITLGGPGQSPSPTNSLNYDDTFIQYVVALLMLWAVILLPFLLLRIFLDYVATLSIEDEHFSYIKNSLGRLSMGNSFFGNVMQNKSVSMPSQKQSSVQRGEGGPVQQVVQQIKNQPFSRITESFLSPKSSKTETSLPHVLHETQATSHVTEHAPQGVLPQFGLHREESRQSEKEKEPSYLKHIEELVQMKTSEPHRSSTIPLKTTDTAVKTDDASDASQDATAEKQAEKKETTEAHDATEKAQENVQSSPEVPPVVEDAK